MRIEDSEENDYKKKVLMSFKELQALLMPIQEVLNNEDIIMTDGQARRLKNMKEDIQEWDKNQDQARMGEFENGN